MKSPQREAPLTPGKVAVIKAAAVKRLLPGNQKKNVAAKMGRIVQRYQGK